MNLKKISLIYEQTTHCFFFHSRQTNKLVSRLARSTNIESRPNENVRYYLKITAMCINIFYIQTYIRV